MGKQERKERTSEKAKNICPTSNNGYSSARCYSTEQETIRDFMCDKKAGTEQLHLSSQFLAHIQHCIQHLSSLYSNKKE